MIVSASAQVRAGFVLQGRPSPGATDECDLRDMVGKGRPRRSRSPTRSPPSPVTASTCWRSTAAIAGACWCAPGAVPNWRCGPHCLSRATLRSGCAASTFPPARTAGRPAPPRRVGAVLPTTSTRTRRKPGPTPRCAYRGPPPLPELAPCTRGRLRRARCRSASRDADPELAPGDRHRGEAVRAQCPRDG